MEISSLPEFKIMFINIFRRRKDTVRTSTKIKYMKGRNRSHGGKEYRKLTGKYTTVVQH